MTTIEKMERELRLAHDAFIAIKHWPDSPEKLEKFADRQIKHIDKTLTAYEAEKDLLAKTQNYHQHGAVAPSCVGCPTAEAEIASGEFVRVRLDRIHRLYPPDIVDMVPYLRGDEYSPTLSELTGNNESEQGKYTRVITGKLNPIRLAIMFHEIYERLAPDYGYETKEETKVFKSYTPNGKLMIAVCGEVKKHLTGEGEL